MKIKVLFTILCNLNWMGSTKAQLKVCDQNIDGIVAIFNADGKSELIMHKSNLSNAIIHKDANTAITNTGNGWSLSKLQLGSTMSKI